MSVSDDLVNVENDDLRDLILGIAPSLDDLPPCTDSSRTTLEKVYRRLLEIGADAGSLTTLEEVLGGGQVSEEPEPEVIKAQPQPPASPGKKRPLTPPSPRRNPRKSPRKQRIPQALGDSSEDDVDAGGVGDFTPPGGRRIKVPLRRSSSGQKKTPDQYSPSRYRRPPLRVDPSPQYKRKIIEADSQDESQDDFPVNVTYLPPVAKSQAVARGPVRRPSRFIKIFLVGVLTCVVFGAGMYLMGLGAKQANPVNRLNEL